MGRCKRALTGPRDVTYYARTIPKASSRMGVTVKKRRSRNVVPVIALIHKAPFLTRSLGGSNLAELKELY